MRPFFCRVGSKRKYDKALISLFPAHRTYVEAFLGGGAVFWRKPPSDVEVINDLDSKLVADYRRILTAPSDPSAYPILKSESAQNAFLAKSHTKPADAVVESLLRRCNGFGGRYLEKGDAVAKVTREGGVTTHEDKLKHIAEYKKRLGHATLTSESYIDVFRKHDGADAFFFLDPPYEMSKGIGYAKGSESFDFQKFADALRGLKGKFLVTINDSPYIRKTFKGFRFHAYKVIGHHSEVSGIGAKDRKELLISNYVLPKQWKSRMTKGVLKGGSYECEEEVLVGAGRGEGDWDKIYASAIAKASEFFSCGAGCPAFALTIIRDYLNAAINIRKAVRAMRVRTKKGSLEIDEIADYLHKADLVVAFQGGMYPFPSKDSAGTVREDKVLPWNVVAKSIRDEVCVNGNTLLVYSLNPVGETPGVLEGHVYAIVPRESVGGGAGGVASPYDAVVMNNMLPGPVYHDYAYYDALVNGPFSFVTSTTLNPTVLADGVILGLLRISNPPFELKSGKGEEDRGKLDVADLWYEADKNLEVFEDCGAGCGSFALTVLEKYLNADIDMPAVVEELKQTKGVMASSRFLEIIREAGWEGTEVPGIPGESQTIDFVGVGKKPAKVFTKGYFADVIAHEVCVNGNALAVMTKLEEADDKFIGHVYTILPVKSEGGDTPYDALIMDNENPMPLPFTIQTVMDDIGVPPTEVASEYGVVIFAKPPNDPKKGGGPGQSKPVTKEEEMRKEYVTHVKERRYHQTIVDDWKVLKETTRILSEGGMESPTMRKKREAAEETQRLLARDYHIKEWTHSRFQALRTLAEESSAALPGIEAKIRSLKSKLRDVDVVEDWAVVRPRLRGGIKQEDLDTYDQIEDVQESNSSEGTDSFSTLVANARRRLNFFAKPSVFTAEDREVLGDTMTALDDVLKTYEDQLKAAGKPVSIDEAGEKAVKRLRRKWKKFIRRVRAMKIQERPPISPPVSPKPAEGKVRIQSFEHLLGVMGYAPADYLRDVRAKARKAGYDPKAVDLSEDGTHKVQIHTPDGRTVKFGRVGYGDFLIWTHLEKRGKAPKGVAKQKRQGFHKSHSAIRGDWRSNKYSPNNLAIALLW